MQKIKLIGTGIVFCLGVVLLGVFTAPFSFAGEVKGTVIMVKGKNVTIQLEGQGFVNKGDKVEVYMDADGIPVPYGTWRVSAVKGNGLIEAEPDDMGVTPPTPTLKATIHATGSRDTTKSNISKS
ncbi:MAG: hypothetical protein GY774_20330 [Planctomycetes bacterium]|nr:hypothetical protein [Planctomycetota bacterium]